MTWNHYYIAESIEDALSTLCEAQASACPVGGGTDLLLEIQQGHRSSVDTLVDLTRIPELTRLEIQDGRLYIGAGVPVSRVAQDPLVHHHAVAVREACALIGGPQVRNSATLGGNVAHALPAADGMISLVAMDGEAEIAAQGGHRFEPILSLFHGPGQSTLNLSKEFLVGFRIRIRHPGEGCAFSRVMRPQGVALPILNMAIWLRREGESITNVRIAVGPAGPIPKLAEAVEDFLRGRIYTQANIVAAVEILLSSMRFRTSPQRSSAEYRYHLCGVLFQEILASAWQRTFEAAGG